MFGKLGWHSIPFDEPLPLVTAGIIAIILSATLDLGLARRAHPLSVA